ncbi:homeobox-domain-containing protein [Rhizoclosmatium globosum]|uniref:Homeobox-domain-containing protein n=1 Tax=Rhizoclosmatium globosum TaxID=329046 RepID=A0A1Y2CYK9_9FUNG|nr:homeobox-domain-containing protein [Rhizoclosmatium globosum]|eukprot:ORY52047.1 homeobox-domain-containing protein [Rhizoclosmatium globosum]
MEHYLMATPDLDTSLVTPSASSTAFNSLPFMNSSFSSPLFDFGDILFPPSQNLDFLFPFTDTPVGTPMVPTPFPVSGISGADLFLANLDQQPFTGIQQLTNPFNPSHYDDDLNITFSAPETPVSQTPILKPAPPSNTIQSCTATTSTQSTKYQHPPRHRIFMEPQETPFRISTASRPATPNRSISHPQPNPFTSQIKRYQRTPIPREQKLRLKELFVQDPYPKPAQMAEIAQELGLEKLKVRIWFQNQRACGKRSSLTE